MKLRNIAGIAFITIILLSVNLPLHVLAAAGDETTTDLLYLVPTIECIGVTATYNGDNNDNNSAVLEYRELGGSWKTAPEMYADRSRKEHRGSIFWLNANTTYEVRVTFSDPDTVSGTNPKSDTATTRNDNPPIGTNYLYVATNGSDETGDGSIENPYRTIQKAANEVSPGTTVLVRGGTYSEVIDVNISGTEANYITFMPYESEQVTITGNHVLTKLFDLDDASYIRIKGFRFEDTKYLINVGNMVELGQSNCIIEDNVFVNPGGRQAILIHYGASKSLIQRNQIIINTELTFRITGIYWWQAGGEHVIRDNTMTASTVWLWDGMGGGPENSEGYLNDTDIYNNTIIYAPFKTGDPPDGWDRDDGIQPEGSDINVRIWNNYIENSNIGIGVCPVLVGPTYIFRNVIYNSYWEQYKLGDGSYGRIYIYHNTFYTTHTADGYKQTNSGIGNIVSKNNIVHAGRYVFEIASPIAGGPMDFDYDSLYTTDPSRFIKWPAAASPSLAEFQSKSGQELNAISVPDVRFTDVANGDLTLASDSPCIDAGVNLPGFNDANSPWPSNGNAPDMGAYEFDSGEPPPPQPPVLNPIGDKVAHPDTTLEFTVSAYDPNNDELTYSADNLPPGASFNPTTRTFSWTPTVEQVGSYPGVHFEVTDQTFTDSEDITINVTVNQAPVLTNPGDKNTSENSLLTFTLSADDPDEDPLTYSANNLPSGASLDPNSGVFSWTPNYDQAGTYPDIQFTVSDSQLTDSENITINVSNTNRAPVLASIGNKTVTEGETLQFSVSANDPDNDPLTYSASNLPVGASFNTTSRVFKWTPLETQVGSYPGVRFTAQDSGALTDHEDITVTVRSISENPTPGGGGGNGGGGGGSGGGGATSLTGMMTGDGKIVIEVLCTLDDQVVTIILNKDTIVKDRNGRNASYIRIRKTDEQINAGEYCRLVTACYDVQPSGITFTPSATIIFKYNPRSLPEGISENSLRIAQYDMDNDEWIDLGGTVDTDARTVTTTIRHLSFYALLADVHPASLEIANFSVSPAEIIPGDTVTASVVVNNRGDLHGDCVVELKLDNTVIQTKYVELAGHNSETLTFTITSDVIGDHRLSIGNISRVFSVVMPEPPVTFKVSGLTINPDSVQAGENVDISALITNTSDRAGSYLAALVINDLIVQTKRVTLDGGQSVMVSFSVTPDLYGLNQVKIGGLQDSFEVKPITPSVSAGFTGQPKVEDFGAALNYDEETNKLIYAKIIYEMNQPYDAIPNARLKLVVHHDGELLEQVQLLTLSHLQADGKTGHLIYIPARGWEIGEYSFVLQLYEGDTLIQNENLPNVIVGPESVTRIVSWGTLGSVVGVAMILTITIISVIIYRKREMLEEEY